MFGWASEHLHTGLLCFLDKYLSSSCDCERISLNTMTLQIQSDHVYTQLGVAISVTGIAQVSRLVGRSALAMLLSHLMCYCLCALCCVNSNNSVTVVPALLLFVPCQYHALKEVITDVLCCVLHGAKQYLFSPRVILAPSSCELVCLRQWLIIAQCLPCVRYGPARIGPSGPVPSWSEVVKGMPDQGLDCFVSQGRFFCVCVWCFWCM